MGIFLSAQAQTATPDTVQVKDFGAQVNDGIDDAPAIQQAIDHAIANDIPRVTFEAGTYDIISLKAKPIKTANYPGYEAVVRRIFGPGSYDVDNFSSWGRNHIHVAGATGLTLEGAVDADGNPATEMLRHNPMNNHKAMPAIFMLVGCDGIGIENFVFDNTPNHSTSGEVVEVGDDYVVAEIFEDLPRIDNMACYCANVWDMETRKLKKVPSLTFGTSPANWRTVPGGNGRLMRIDKIDFAEYVDPGDGISWWIGHNGKQVFFGLCRDVSVENVLVPNAAGFGLEAFNCVNVYGNRVRFEPRGGQFPVTPRDAWKLAWNDGTVLVENMHVEGVRWDGQNVHGPWFHVVEKTGPRTVTVKKEGGMISLLKTGSDIGFWEGNDVTRRTIADWSYLGKSSNPKRGTDHHISITFEEDLPETVSEETLASAYCWDIDDYTLRNGTFEKIAGAMSIIKNENVLIEGCTFDNIQHPAVVIGTEWQEGTYPRNFTVRDCRFSDSGWVPRLGVRGLIGIADGWGSAMRIRDIYIERNIFENNDLGIDIADCSDVYLTDNTFQNVDTPWQIDPATTRDITLENNSIE